MGLSDRLLSAAAAAAACSGRRKSGLYRGVFGRSVRGSHDVVRLTRHVTPCRSRSSSVLPVVSQITARCRRVWRATHRSMFTDTPAAPARRPNASRTLTPSDDECAPLRRLRWSAAGGARPEVGGKLVK